MTIPSLIANNREKETVVSVKKAYNVINNAVALAKVEYGDITGWGWNKYTRPDENGNVYDAESSIQILEKISPFLNIMRNCGVGQGCFPQKIKLFNGDETLYNTKAASIILSDGSAWVIQSESQNCNAAKGTGPLINSCGGINIDINGFKGPNKVGVDIFSFRVNKDSIIPTGSIYDTVKPFEISCRSDGWACAAWILEKENMDYLKKPVSWN